MRDPVLDESLRRLAGEAATRLSSLIAGGEEVPFDVAENDGDSSLFYRYVPLTRRFIEDHADSLRSLPGFSAACGAVNMRGAAAPFLEARGEPVPSDPEERAAKMLTRFIIELWDGHAEFTLDRGRLNELLDRIDAEVRDIRDADSLVAPVVGLQMAVPTLDLPNGVRLVRADSVDAPIEAMKSEGMARKPWEPQILMIAEQDESTESGDPVADALDRMRMTITVLRLFKAGGVGLGPHAFAPTSEERWRRIATGVSPVRGDGYELSEDEARRLGETAGLVIPRLRAARASKDSGPLGWSLRRYEMGREQLDAADALTDHILALKAILEGDGPVGAPLPVRAAALVAAPENREGARERIEAALRYEKEMIGGSMPEGDGPRIAATWLEEQLRVILLDSATGRLGDSAGVAADETLLVSGLDAGEGSLAQRGDTEEWSAFDVEVVEGEIDRAFDEVTNPPSFHETASSAENSGTTEFSTPFDIESVRDDVDDEDEEITRIMEPVPSDESEIRITAMADAPYIDAEDATPYEEDEDMAIRSDWLSEVSGQDRATIEWPAEGVKETGAGREARHRVDTPRVRHLFPVPDSDWDVSELRYDRTERRYH